MKKQSQQDEYENDFENDGFKIFVVGVIMVVIALVLLTLVKLTEEDDYLYKKTDYTNIAFLDIFKDKVVPDKVTDYAKVELLDTLRDLEVKVESEMVTKADKKIVDGIEYELPSDFRSKLELYQNFYELVEEPSDTYLKKIVTKELNQIKAYVLNHKL